MMMPSIFAESLFDDFMDFPFGGDFYTRQERRPHYDKKEVSFMKTDIKETDQSYELDIDLPGFKKEDVSAQLENGYLTIKSSTSTDNGTKDNNGKYIRRERFVGNCSRSFYVGEAVTQEDIRARFEDGTLKLTVPKKDAKPAAEQKKYITIEG